MIRARVLPILLSALLTAAILPARASAQSTDIVEQHLMVDLTATDLLVDIQATIKAVDATSDLWVPVFAMPVETAEVDGVIVPVTPDAMYPQYVLHLALGSTVAAGNEVSVHIRIRGAPMCASMSVPRHIACEWTPSHEAVLAANGPGQSFYITNLFGIDTFTGDVTIKAPPAFEVVAGQGSAISVTTAADGTKTWKYAFTTPTESIPVYASDGTTVTSTSGFHVKGYFRDTMMEAADMRRAVSLTSRIVPYYGQLYDMPAPFDEAHILIVPPSFEFGGLGFLGNVIWAEYVVGAYDFLLEQGVAHEFAHTWWANLASGSDPNEAPFLAEAFAEYTAWRGLGWVHGDAMRTAGVRMNAVWYMYTRPQGRDVAILDPNVTSSPAYVHATYHKGSTVVRTLEEAVGTEAFTRVLRKFLKRGVGGLSVQALSGDMYHETGYDATSDIEQWLTRTGYPTVKAGAAFDDTGATVHLEAQGGFHFHVPVRFTFRDGSVSDDALEVTGPDTTKHYPLSKRPALIEIDPRWTFVRELSPALEGDVTLDGEIDAADLIEIALHRGALPALRRRDGHFDPLYDVDGDHRVDDADLAKVVAAAHLFGTHP